MLVREQWCRALAQVPVERLQEVASNLKQQHDIRYTHVPEAGLTMLQMREPNCGERFFLGEAPLATAQVEIEHAGNTHQGAAQVMGDNTEQVTAMAICDAVLAAELPGSDTVDSILAEGWQAIQQEQRIRHALLHRTEVDFSLLEEDDDD